MNLKLVFYKFNVASPNHWGFNSCVHLDIGCGDYARNPFLATTLYGADIQNNCPKNLSQEKYFKLTPGGSLPFADNSIDSISGFDFIEHLSREPGIPNMFISFMNEASRVLTTGGVLFCVTPSFPSPAAFQDPTHVNFITEETVNYFLLKDDGNGIRDDGISTNFELVIQFWVGPFSQIRKKHWDSAGLDFKSLMRVFRSLPSLRAAFSSWRHPTHLVWVLRKV
jgi:SAM-dependent methyltransferase